MAFGDVLQTPDLARAEQCSILSVHSVRRIQLRTLIFKYISNQLGESFNTAEHYKLPLSIYYVVNSTTPSSPKNHTQVKLVGNKPPRATVDQIYFYFIVIDGLVSSVVRALVS